MAEELQQRSAALDRWDACTDRTAATAPAREGLQKRFERLADPDGLLDPVERAKRVEDLRADHYRDMRAKSAESRAKAAGAAEYIRQLVDSAPPLTAAQRDRLAALLRPGKRTPTSVA
ncbi:MAG: hypothetical protein JWO67_2892 [Streptosporangiaceae bacterium]|nr:hypothetical protein [Streptosporangiaceae bacterium]